MDDSEFAKFAKSLEGRLGWLMVDVKQKLVDLEEITDGLEGIIKRRRSECEKKWTVDSDTEQKELLAKAKDGGLGDFDTFDELWKVLRKTDPRELLGPDRSIRADLYDEWMSFEHFFEKEHLAEFSAETNSLVRHGGFVSAYAILEISLGKFCELLRDYRNVALKVTDLAKQGSDIERSRNYLEKVLGIETENSGWGALDVFVQMRHCIAHNAGMVDDRFDRRLKPYSQLDGIAEIKENRLLLNANAVGEFLRHIHQLFEQLEKAALTWSTVRPV